MKIYLKKIQESDYLITALTVKRRANSFEREFQRRAKVNYLYSVNSDARRDKQETIKKPDFTAY